MIRPAQALRRIFVCEVMGRYSGFLALEAAMGIGADVVLIPERIVEVQIATIIHSFKSVARNESIGENRAITFDLNLTRLPRCWKLHLPQGSAMAFVILAEGIGQLTKRQIERQVCPRIILKIVFKDWDHWISAPISESMF